MQRYGADYRYKSIIRTREGSRLVGASQSYVTSACLLAVCALAVGLLALWLTADSYSAFRRAELFVSYFRTPFLPLMNLLPPLLLAALGWFLFGRTWAAYLLAAIPTLGFALVNYYKILLRGDPFLASDFRLARTAGGILGQYSLTVTRLMLVIAALFAAMLLILIFFAKASLPGKTRIAGILICVILTPLIYTQLYLNVKISNTAHNSICEHEWSQVEFSVSRGSWYPFILSLRRAFPSTPKGYSAEEADRVLAGYSDGSIPADKRVNVLGVMLEAYADLRDFPMLAELADVRSVYAPLYALEKESVSGKLLTNIFAGGTVDTEWGFLSGYSHHDDFRANVDSYVRYFNSQGYTTLYRHPGYSWYYNRENINRYLGFDERMFIENGFDAYVDAEAAPYHSDRQLFDFLLEDLDAHTARGETLFSFSVSFQNHGPYSDVRGDNCRTHVSGPGWSGESCAVIDNYLAGIAETTEELSRFASELEKRGEPVVLVVFGDHKPWLGYDSAVYNELGVNLDVTTEEGFYNYYSTPYLIWANSAAKAALGEDFTGEGADLSPCFLMTELFDLCSWEGPAFMGLAREMRAVTPLLHEQGIFMENGKLTDTLSPEAAELYGNYRCAEYRRETKGIR
ncbi:MAG: LTA synthase family protein [Oscillospiraceae bacterium]|nr:LTA synthase family protein [Oscillospiraceae bacterium]